MQRSNPWVQGLEERTMLPFLLPELTISKFRHTQSLWLSLYDNIKCSEIYAKKKHLKFYKNNNTIFPSTNIFRYNIFSFLEIIQNKNFASIENLLFFFFFFVCTEYFSLSLLFKSIFLHDSFISKIEKKKKKNFIFLDLHLVAIVEIKKNCQKKNSTRIRLKCIFLVSFETIPY